MKTIMKKGFTVIFAGSIFLFPTYNYSIAEELAESLKELQYLLDVGEWTGSPQFYNAAGDVVGEGKTGGYAKVVFDGNVIQQGGGLTAPFVVSGFGFIYPNPYAEGYIYTSYDTRNNFYVYYGDFKDGELIMISEDRPSGNGGTIRFKRVDTNITPSSFDSILYQSRDQGKTWTITNQQTNWSTKDKKP